ncbi:MAG: hypothetical protein FWD61_04320 [Phycisphaerales bacterium]|nr:hypothetical protein [Phycisphaerales bacterium]
MKKRAMFGLVLVVGLSGGCCLNNDHEDKRPLPEAISLGEQLYELNTRARAMPVVRAKGTVVVRYVDDQGNSKQDSADGTLLVRQRFGAAGINDPADVYLQGRVAGQEVFQSAKNQEKWWFISRDKKGWMGDVTGMPDFSGEETGGNGGGVMRADLMLQVLAITEVQLRTGETIAMKVRDATRSNDMDILQLRRDGTAWVKRELIVDRDTRNVRQVTLGDPAGKLVVRADLKDYQSVDNGKGGEVAFPRDIWVTYPAQKLSVHFAVDKVEVFSEAPELPFETPDFVERGIQLQR